MKASFNIEGHYEAYREVDGQFVKINASKNKLTPVYLTELSNSSLSSVTLGVTNQIDLDITSTSDNFAYSELISYNKTASKYGMDRVNKKPVEWTEDETYYFLHIRQCYRLPAKNLGNITGYALYKNNRDKISVSYVRDISGFKGTISHTERDSTYLFYTLTFRMNKTDIPRERIYFNRPTIDSDYEGYAIYQIINPTNIERKIARVDADATILNVFTKNWQLPRTGQRRDESHELVNKTRTNKSAQGILDIRVETISKNIRYEDIVGDISKLTSPDINVCFVYSSIFKSPVIKGFNKPIIKSLNYTINITVTINQNEQYD